ncbi:MULTISPECIES: aldo/keto reductase [Kitasatospora]|uniref:Putative aldo/keto reductase n=1 Tax=Kitasatospora setae (strain ATCC 33774 / DSM 43861 / JCM 3304 / KCC A-0304 / NBRC 14216 / KM-6054) TaxID=452652 RepID=E4N2K0_KITSK|nr:MULTISPECIES: aldo/keto reductase [Kitasatospora]BAJ32384.1 putative aldo/keto reductase [Kitasatospora setae KM-6054]
MEQRLLGRTGLRVSRLALGTLTWGRETDEHEAAEQLKAFVDAGGSLVDTADVYADGGAEYLLSRLTDGLVPRSELVIATKAGALPGSPRPDTSRGHLLDALDGSLRRLNTDHVDLWQVHAHDPATPAEETLHALDLAVSSGRARYVGLCQYSGWQLAKAAARQHALPGATPLASVQLEYSLLQRGIEREALPAALDAGIGLLARSPLGRGVLTGKYRHGVPPESRGSSPHPAGPVQPYLGETSRRIVDALATAADGLASTPLKVALAWVRDRPGVSATLLGARTSAQLQSSLSVEALTLPGEIRAALDDVSAPVHRYPDQGWTEL